MRANLDALRTLREIQQQQRQATPEEQAVLARWSGWGAAPQVFDTRRDEFAWAREQLDELLSAEERTAAERNVLNAHYTDPALVSAIWDGLGELGLNSGRVLEPGCGTGNFLGLAPEQTTFVGVELDPVSAGIASALYPQAQILAESFADTRADEATFDAAVGNVPFGNAALADKRHNPSGHSIHNHFLVKSLHLTKPGGMVAVLTSRYTLDAINPSARREMAAMADLVGAVRLPSGAHQRTAGTQAVTDLLILRRREHDRSPATDTEWEQTRRITLGEHEIPVNAYFVEHPEHVLGEMGAGEGHGMYRADDLHVAATEPTAPALRSALSSIATTARTAGLQAAPADVDQQAAPAALVSARDHRTEGHLTAHEDGSFTQLVRGLEQPHEVPASQADELRALLGVRDATLTLLDAESADLGDGAHLDELRTDLNRRYDDYVARFGPVNRFSWRRTGRTDPETGADKYARQRPKQGGFRGDPHAPAVAALERFDPETQTAAKDDIFARRVIAPRAPRLGADSPADAVAICLDAYAEIRLDEIARLLGTDTDDARTQLGALVFDDPATASLVPAAEYLSGNVRAKYDAAQAAHDEAPDERYRPNLDALAGVIPTELGPEDIHAALGAAWIGEEDVQQFLRETLGDASVRVQHAGGANWLVSGNEVGVAATETWGTDRVSAPRIAQSLLQQRPIAVYDTVKDIDGDRRVFNADATVEAQNKASELNDAFGEWVWDEPERAQRLADQYNYQFNAVVTRTYDDAELSLPGLALTFEPRSHQISAVARMIHEPAVGLYHEVGAGKTAEMTMGCMELRRLGLVRKPAVIVPNHMLEQFGREWSQLYPQAKLLVASSQDLSGQGRREFVARCATGDWDAVIMTQGAFERIPVSLQAQQEYLQRELDTLRTQLERVSGRDNPMGVKKMQNALLRAEERVKSKLDTDRDPGLTFEATGIDYLVVDEAHSYKNLRTPSNIPGAALDGSNRASDLDMKLNQLRQRHGQRVATFATATPIANTITEAYVMQRFLRPDLLAQAGLEDFDTWAGTFGQITTAVELSPDSSSFRMKSRFAKFSNVPELLRMWHVSADIKTQADLNLDTPAIVERDDGKREARTVTVPASTELGDYIARIAERAEIISQGGVDPEVDNMLKISTDGRAAALDLRLVGGDTAETTKVDVAAEHIAALHHEHADDTYYDPDGTPQLRQGSLQLVFCDLGTPSPDKDFSVYDALRDALVERGVPRGQVRFMHEANNDREKGELFAAARSGQISVLMGSTQRMGVGTNVQARAVALHHMDCPWRPADVAQREGRLIRQGNQNPEVHVRRYVTEGSFDAYSWQTVARKAEFIAQVMRGTLDTREIEDIGDSALSYNEVKALATGNPLLLDHAHAKSEVTRLERLERGHDRTQRRLPELITAARAKLAHAESQRQHLDTHREHRRSTRGDDFAMTINGTRHTDRADAKQQLAGALEQFHNQREVRRLRHGETTSWERFARLGGVELTATATQRMASPTADVAVRVHGVPDSAVGLKNSDWEPGGTGLITRLENQVGGLDKLATDTDSSIETARAEIERSHAQLGQPFPHADDLAAAREHLQQIEDDMNEQAKPPDPDTAPAEDPDRHSEHEFVEQAIRAADAQFMDFIQSRPADASAEQLTDARATLDDDDKFVDRALDGAYGERVEDLAHELVNTTDYSHADVATAILDAARTEATTTPAAPVSTDRTPSQLTEIRDTLKDDREFLTRATDGAYGERAQTLVHGLQLDPVMSDRGTPDLADALVEAVAAEATGDDPATDGHGQQTVSAPGGAQAPARHPAALAAMAAPPTVTPDATQRSASPAASPRHTRGTRQDSEHGR